MGLTKENKLERLAAERGPLEHELYAAEVQVTVKEAGVKHKVTGVTQEQVEDAKTRVKGIEAQLKALDDLKEKVDLEDDEG